MFVAGSDGNSGCDDDVDVAACWLCKHIADHAVDNDCVGVKRKMRSVLFPCSEGEDEKRRLFRKF